MRSLEGALFFLYHQHGHFSGHVFMQPDRDLELAQRLDRLFQLDLAAVDGIVCFSSASAMSLEVTEPKS